MDREGSVHYEEQLLLITVDPAIIPGIYNVGIPKDDS